MTKLYDVNIENYQMRNSLIDEKYLTVYATYHNGRSCQVSSKPPQNSTFNLLSSKGDTITQSLRSITLRINSNKYILLNKTHLFLTAYFGKISTQSSIHPLSGKICGQAMALFNSQEIFK